MWSLVEEGDYCASYGQIDRIICCLDNPNLQRLATKQSMT
jgi:hypothetical protein